MKKSIRDLQMKLGVVIFIVFITSIKLQAQVKVFNGFYGGLETGRQNIIGGSLVNNIDVLSHDTRTVVSFQAGLRYQFDMGIVLGAEIGMGFFNGDLKLSDPANQLNIKYKCDKQTDYGLIAGFAFGTDKEWLVFGYLSETIRNFSVEVMQAANLFDQNDEQGILRYGIGLEKQITNHLNMRISAGSARADFGTQQTNIEIKNKFEFAAAAIFHL